MKRYIKPQQLIIPVASEANLCAGSPMGVYSDKTVEVQGAPTFNGLLDDEEE